MNFVNKPTLEAWGRDAAEQFLSHQVPLNETVEKIAAEHQLNENQIQRVCEFANISTNLELFEKSADKRFTFEQADASAVMEKLGGVSKAASIQAEEYLKDLPPLLTTNRDAHIRMRNEWGEEKTASPAVKSKSELHDELEARQEAIRELQWEQKVASATLEDAQEQLDESIKQMFLNKEASFGEICAAMMTHGEDMRSKGIIKEALLKSGFRLVKADVLPKAELEKLAYSVPMEYISDHLDSPGAPYAIRNGRHTSWAILDTLVKQRDKPAEYDKPLQLLNDDVKYIRRELVE
jgi:hypothetical protein